MINLFNIKNKQLHHKSKLMHDLSRSFLQTAIFCLSMCSTSHSWASVSLGSEQATSVSKRPALAAPAPNFISHAPNFASQGPRSTPDHVTPTPTATQVPVGMQRLEQQMVQLQQQNQQLSQSMQQAQQQLLSMHQQIALLVRPDNTPTFSQQLMGALLGWSQMLKQLLGNIGFKLVTGLLAIFLLWLLWSLRPQRNRQTSATSNEATATDLNSSAKQALATVAAQLKSAQQEAVATRPAGLEEGEYDFLSSEDAIPTKLDLARAYIAMDNHSAARLVLQEVLVQGDASQRAMAQDLCAQLKMEVS